MLIGLDASERPSLCVLVLPHQNPPLDSTRLDSSRPATAIRFSPATPFTAAAAGTAAGAHAAGSRERTAPPVPSVSGTILCSPLRPRPGLHLQLSFPVAGLAVRSPSPFPWRAREVFDALPLCVLVHARHHSLHGVVLAFFRGWGSWRSLTDTCATVLLCFVSRTGG